MARVTILLITVALVVGMAGCAPTQYQLTISSTPNGSVITPGEGTFTYNEGKVVRLVARSALGYGFVEWTGDVATINTVNSFSTTITMNGDCSITANFGSLIIQQFTAEPLHFSPVELYTSLAATFRMGSYGLLQEVICKLIVALGSRVNGGQ